MDDWVWEYRSGSFEVFGYGGRRENERFEEEEETENGEKMSFAAFFEYENWFHVSRPG